MTEQWSDQQPIYRQLRDRVIDLILQGVFAEQQAIPSVRQVAADFQINHLTVAKAYQELTDLGILEKKRGIGMYVKAGARAALLTMEREKFAQQEVPALLARLKQLGVSEQELIEMINNAKQELGQ